MYLFDTYRYMYSTHWFLAAAWGDCGTKLSWWFGLLQPLWSWYHSRVEPSSNNKRLLWYCNLLWHFGYSTLVCIGCDVSNVETMNIDILRKSKRHHWQLQRWFESLTSTSTRWNFNFMWFYKLWSVFAVELVVVVSQKHMRGPMSVTMATSSSMHLGRIRNWFDF